jgi:hypothetical protein
VSIHYPSLKKEERSKIWKYHINRLEETSPDIAVSASVFSYLESEETKKLPFNGRQIRNIFQTAVSLALYEAESSKNPKKKALLKSDHLRKVITLSAGFQDYLNRTRNPDSQRAFDEEVRQDDYE